MARKQAKKVASKFVRRFIVEGYTETNYIGLLKSIFPSSENDNPKNCEGGGAKSVLREAKKEIKQGNYSEYIVIFDKDTDSPANDKLKAEIRKLPIKKEIIIIEPCFENWLLCHFEKQHSTHLNCEGYEKRLRDNYIPNYEKNNVQLLAKYIDREKIVQAVHNCKQVGQYFANYFSINQHID